MTEKEFEQETTSFINELNKLSSLICEINFDKNCEYPCCFNPKYNSIIFNYDLLNENNQSALYFLGDNYLDYFILHEYGHFIYNEEVKEYIKKIMNGNQIPLLNFFIKHYDFFIKRYIEQAKVEPYFLISINTEYYWAKQLIATCEFMADYFVIKQINKNFRHLNSTSFKLWRTNEVLEQYNHCHNNNWLHIEPLRYYHIPETILNKTINFENDSITDLINLSLNNSLKSLILILNQLTNHSEYYNNATNFSGKISSIIEELNRLRQ